MSVRHKKRLNSSRARLPERPANRRAWLYPFLLGAALGSISIFAASRKPHPEAVPRDSSQSAPVGTPRKYPSLAELCNMADDELRGQDVAVLNLSCAERLPGSESLDVQKCAWTLNEWADHVRSETNRHLYRVHDPKYAKEYHGSASYFRISMMLQVLQEDCGVHYNKERITNVDFKNSRDLFIHGMICSDNGGTCVSMPVLYTAIARRLGYPVCLVSAKAHLFCRWDTPKERFNIEATGPGFDAHSDDYYTKWPMPISDEEFKKGYYLKSMTPREELAVFLAARGHCLEDNGRKAEAIVSYAQALAHHPDSPDCFGFLAGCLGYRHLPGFERTVARQAIPEPPMVYPMQVATNPALATTACQNRIAAPDLPGGVQQEVPYNVFKPSGPDVPTGFQNPVSDPQLGFPQ
jgi:Transglutaminase-like superfamily